MFIRGNRTRTDTTVVRLIRMNVLSCMHIQDDRHETILAQKLQSRVACAMDSTHAPVWAICSRLLGPPSWPRCSGRIGSGKAPKPPARTPHCHTRMLPSPVYRLPSPVSRLPSPVSRLPSPVSRLPSSVSRLPSTERHSRKACTCCHKSPHAHMC